MHAMHTTVTTILGSTPDALAFSRDMFLNIPPIADWQAIGTHCKHHVNENLCQANRKWHQYDYAPGQQVLKKVHDPTKLGVRTSGLYTIDHVHINGNVSIIMLPGVTKHINIWKILPYCLHVFHMPLWRYIVGIGVHRAFLSFFTSPLHINLLWQTKCCNGGEECHANGINRLWIYRVNNPYHRHMWYLLAQYSVWHIL